MEVIHYCIVTAALFFCLSSQKAMIFVSVLTPSWEDHFEEQRELRLGHWDKIKFTSTCNCRVRNLYLKLFSVGSQWRFWGKPIKSRGRDKTRRGRIREALDTQCVFLMITNSNRSVRQFPPSRPTQVLQKRAGNHAGALFSIPCIASCLTLLNAACVTVPAFLSPLPTTPPPQILGGVARPGT